MLCENKTLSVIDSTVHVISNRSIQETGRLHCNWVFRIEVLALVCVAPHVLGGPFIAATRSQGRLIASCSITTQLYSAFNCPTIMGHSQYTYGYTYFTMQLCMQQSTLHLQHADNVNLCNSCNIWLKGHIHIGRGRFREGVKI